MGDEIQASCTRLAQGPVKENVKEPDIAVNSTKKEINSMIHVGKKAPDFTASAYHEGKFVTVKLSDFAGKWVVLCFYPGDFTFV